MFNDGWLTRSRARTRACMCVCVFFYVCVCARARAYIILFCFALLLLLLLFSFLFFSCLLGVNVCMTTRHVSRLIYLAKYSVLTCTRWGLVGLGRVQRAGGGGGGRVIKEWR